MIRDFFFVVRVFVYAAVLALLLQVQWKGESLEIKTMRLVHESSMGAALTSTAQKFAFKLTGKVDDTSKNLRLPEATPTKPAQTRALLNLRRSESAQEATTASDGATY